ncbi:hypothetical protein I3760_06G138400 [Carya illinoinensis]|nr:hypothetical protein I3760_06G138400 [Carya illinoinensis]
MEDKRSEAGIAPAAGVESPASEPASSRRRAGAQKRKASNLGSSNSSSGPSKRVTREKALLSHAPIHNGPLTRARQGPNNFAGAAVLASAGGAAASAKKSNDQAAPAVLVEELSKESELEALEAVMEAEFEAIRSRGANVHVVPSHCGWFSWTKVHSIEELTLPSFFNGKSETRTPDMYIEIRNWIMKKFHFNPNTPIELKDLSELEVGDLDARQEVMEFLDHWGLINFHPFPPTDSALPSADNDGETDKDSLVEKLYRFETLEMCPPVFPKTNLTTPAVPSGLFPESAIAEELARDEGPSVEYHCNSCSADCSRKRYHCQKQADFDLCTDCFNNGKFGYGMSSLDFILMEPAEVPGVSCGKWTDQETLLLLEALELYKENWNEIAEHVATKTKAQCILHFLQMPIEETFLDGDVDIDASSKEIVDPDSTNNDSSVAKDAPETEDVRTGAGEGQPLTSAMETSNTDTSEVKIAEESRQEDGSELKVSQEVSRADEISEVQVDQEVGENWALKALREAFEAVGYPPEPDNPLSFSEVGNPVMALAVFLARLVGPDAAIASAHSSLKSISGCSPGLQLAARHCFLLEDPSDGKKEPVPVGSERDAQEDGNLEGRNEKEGNSPSVLDEKELSNNHNNNNIEECATEETPNGKSAGKAHAAKEQGVIASSEVVRPQNLDETSNSGLPKDHPQSTMMESDDLTSKVELLPSSVEESKERTSVGEPLLPVEAPKVEHTVSDSLHAEKNEQEPVTSDSVREPPQRTEAPKDGILSDSLPPKEYDRDQSVATKSSGKPLQSSEVSMDVDVVSDSLPNKKNEPQQPVPSNSVEEPSQPTEAPTDVVMVSDSVASENNQPSQPVTSNSVDENGANKGEDLIEEGKKVKHETIERKNLNKFDKVKRAAVTALSAAAVKAKLLANQEEDQIRQLATFLIEKQLHKLETKLAFFSEMENVVMRVREQLDRSRQRLYHERAQIIAARLGLPASASRAMPSSLPTNRIATNFANSVARPPMSMTYQRPSSMLRHMGTVAPSPSNPLTSNTVAGSSIRPSGQDKLSSVGTK